MAARPVSGCNARNGKNNPGFNDRRRGAGTVNGTNRRLLASTYRNPRWYGIENIDASLHNAGLRAMLTDVREDAVELIETVVGDDQLTGPLGAVLYGHLGAQALAEVVLKPADVRIERRLGVGARVGTLAL